MLIKSGLKKFYVLLAGVAITLLLFLGLVLAGLWTETGREYISSILEHRLSSGIGYEINIGRISGKLPFNIFIDRIEISDKEGVWLSIENAGLSWKAAPLLKGKIHIEELGARQVHIKRRPNYSDNNGKTDFLLPQWPPDLPPINLERLRLDHLSIK